MNKSESTTFNLQMSAETWSELRALQVKQRWDWPATFSANALGDIWPFTHFGHTQKPDRLSLDGHSKVLEMVVDAYLEARPGGGRFFISDDGAWYRPLDSRVQFLHFIIVAGEPAWLGRVPNRPDPAPCPPAE